jgi:hypothetical protein
LYLVIAGGLDFYRIAEALKRIPEKQRILLPWFGPLWKKIATIVSRLIAGLSG